MPLFLLPSAKETKNLDDMIETYEKMRKQMEYTISNIDLDNINKSLSEKISSTMDVVNTNIDDLSDLTQGSIVNLVTSINDLNAKLNALPKIYTSHSDPSPSFGNDGDVWIKY